MIKSTSSITMTSSPGSLNDESLNGSWIDINSASQIHSPMDNDSSEFLMPPFPSTSGEQTETMHQNLGLISFQVERFLQEAQRNQTPSQDGLSVSQQNVMMSNVNDDNSGVYMSDTDASLDDLGSRALINSLKINQEYDKEQMKIKQQCDASNNNINSNDLLKKFQLHNQPTSKLSKSNGDYLIDQLSDSLSILSRASAQFDHQTNFEDLDWLWDWTSQPEYFAGQEWKVYAPKQDYLMKQRQLYNSQGNNIFSGQVLSLLFLTNVLSIIIGAGLTYSIMMRRPSV